MDERLRDIMDRSYTHVGMWTMRKGREIALFSRPVFLGYYQGNYIRYASDTREMLKWLNRCADRDFGNNRWLRLKSFILGTRQSLCHPWGEVKYDRKRDRFCFELHHVDTIDWDVILFLIDELNLTDETVVLRHNGKYVF